MGIPYTALNDILNQRRPLTANTAMLFEAAMGVNTDLLMRMQLKYNMQIVRQDKSLALQT
jgi:plasmid maintenance system antidote protein VapI